MTTQQMSEVDKTSGQSGQGNSQSVSQLNSILLSDGWHNITNPRKLEWSVSSSPATDGPYTTLQYQDEQGQYCYVPFRQIQGFKFNIGK